MKILYINKRWFRCVSALLCLAAVYALSIAAGRAFRLDYVGALAGVGQADTFEVRSRLLMEGHGTASGRAARRTPPKYGQTA